MLAFVKLILPLQLYRNRLKLSAQPVILYCPKNITINIVRTTALKQAAIQLQQRLSIPTGYKVSLTEKASAIIKLELNTKEDTKLDSEGYYLSVTPQNIIIKANKPAGLFYGVQTLLHLFPPSEDSVLVSKAEWKAPCVEIIDYPRFEWRRLNA